MSQLLLQWLHLLELLLQLATPAVTVPGSCSRVSATPSVATPTGTAAHPATPAVAVLGSCSSVSVIPPVTSLQCMYNSFLSSWTSQLTEELQLCKISRFFDQSPLVTQSVIVYGDLTLGHVCPWP